MTATEDVLSMEVNDKGLLKKTGISLLALA